MTTWFVTRHPGAIEWAAQQGLQVDRQVPHLDVAEVQAGDVVIGILPVNLAAEVQARGGAYMHLSMDTPHQWRGVDLDVEQMRQCNARLERFKVTRED